MYYCLRFLPARVQHTSAAAVPLRSVLRGPRSTPNPNPDPRQEIEALLFQLPADTEAGAAPVTDVKAAVLPLTKARRVHAHRTHRPAAWPRYHWHRERGAGAAAVGQRGGTMHGAMHSALPPRAQALGNGTTVLVGMPGAFTPTCTDQHLPGFIKQVRWG